MPSRGFVEEETLRPMAGLVHGYVMVLNLWGEGVVALLTSAGSVSA
jgi:hypothetical protein